MCCDTSECDDGLVCAPNGFYTECQALPVPSVRAMPASLAFSMVQGGLVPEAKTVFVTNAGMGTLNFRVTEDVPWLSVDPLQGAAAEAGASIDLSVTIVGTDFEIGTLEGTLTLTDDAADNSPLDVPVTFTVSAP